MNNDMAFMCFAQATEGDFTVGQNKLNKVAEILAHNWVTAKIDPNDPFVYRQICKLNGFNYDSLLDEEVDYLQLKVEEEIRQHGS